MDHSILDDIPDLSNYKSFTERYFSKRYVLNVNGIENNDIMLMIHSNRVTLLSLAPSHFFFKTDGDYKINFNIGNIDRLSNKVTGKGKRGGQVLHPKSVVCKVEFDNGTNFDVISCIKGKLIEINEELVKNPKLLKEMPDSNGFIAIILPNIANSDANKDEMLTHEEYVKIVK